MSARHGIHAKARLFDRLFSEEFPDDMDGGKTFLDALNPKSLEIRDRAVLEPAIGKLSVGTLIQLERLAYFRIDESSAKGSPVLNRTIQLRDSWAKIEKKMKS